MSGVLRDGNDQRDQADMVSGLAGVPHSGQIPTSGLSKKEFVVHGG
jgi:hypothetical protein